MTEKELKKLTREIAEDEKEIAVLRRDIAKLAAELGIPEDSDLEFLRVEMEKRHAKLAKIESSIESVSNKIDAAIEKIGMNYEFNAEGLF